MVSATGNKTKLLVYLIYMQSYHLTPFRLSCSTWVCLFTLNGYVLSPPHPSLCSSLPPPPLMLKATSPLMLEPVVLAPVEPYTPASHILRPPRPSCSSLSSSPQSSPILELPTSWGHLVPQAQACPHPSQALYSSLPTHLKALQIWYHNIWDFVLVGDESTYKINSNYLHYNVELAFSCVTASAFGSSAYTTKSHNKITT